MNVHYHIAILIITCVTMITSISLLIVAVNIQKEVKYKLDDAKQYVDDAKRSIKNVVPSLPHSLLKVVSKL